GTAGEPEPLRMVAAAEAAALVHVRRTLRSWLSGAGVDEDSSECLQLAAYEALANAASHAYPDADGGSVSMRAWLDGQVVHVEVADHGRWRPPPADPGSRGRGLLLMERCVDQVELDRTSTGTRVGLSRAVTLHPTS
ncbi:ATP-binding protein, partial [Actinoalloteichus spitiensis]|uniref:ATP-binding protein n=1 Tax=Actinoalloteichus spitiensis TaxID=252394 RepID=UPI000367DC69